MKRFFTTPRRAFALGAMLILASAVALGARKYNMSVVNLTIESGGSFTNNGSTTQAGAQTLTGAFTASGATTVISSPDIDITGADTDITGTTLNITSDQVYFDGSTAVAVNGPAFGALSGTTFGNTGDTFTTLWHDTLEVDNGTASDVYTVTGVTASAIVIAVPLENGGQPVIAAVPTTDTVTITMAGNVTTTTTIGLLILEP